MEKIGSLNDAYANSKRYYCTLDTLPMMLERHGVAVLPSILDEKECQHMREGMWDFLENATSKLPQPMRRDDSTTWKSITELWPLHSMLIKQFGIGHCQMLWDLRQNPKIMQPFETLWKSNDLLTSFDGASLHMPPEKTGKGWMRSDSLKSLWLHTDQTFLCSEKKCYQAWVTANAVDKGDATLAVIVNSHHYHASFAKAFDMKTVLGKKIKENWFKLEEKHVKWFLDRKDCELMLLSVPAGSMVFWDSRAMHCGTQALKGRLVEKIRCVAYVSMLPRQVCTAKELKKRIHAFETLRTTSHWVSPFKMNPTVPRTYGKPVNVAPVKPPRITPLMKRLVGY